MTECTASYTWFLIRQRCCTFLIPMALQSYNAPRDCFIICCPTYSISILSCLHLLALFRLVRVTVLVLPTNPYSYRSKNYIKNWNLKYEKTPNSVTYHLIFFEFCLFQILSIIVLFTILKSFEFSSYHLPRYHVIAIFVKFWNNFEASSFTNLVERIVIAKIYCFVAY